MLMRVYEQFMSSHEESVFKNTHFLAPQDFSSAYTTLRDRVLKNEKSSNVQYLKEGTLMEAAASNITRPYAFENR
jgi:hypothetical protein